MSGREFVAQWMAEKTSDERAMVEQRNAEFFDSPCNEDDCDCEATTKVAYHCEICKHYWEVLESQSRAAEWERCPQGHSSQAQHILDCES